MITAVDGVLVGHHTDADAATGCTVVLLPEGTVGGYAVVGSAPATRETHVMDPWNLVTEVHAFVLSGGSAFGLGAAQGVVELLAERRVGFPVRDVVVPIVPAASLYDLSVGAARWPTADDARAATEAASKDVAEGSVGAGTGATVAKRAGPRHARKGGVGTAAERTRDGLVVGALVACNAWGDVIGEDGSTIAGAGAGHDGLVAPFGATPDAGASTTLAVVATNARFDKASATHVARMASAGIARSVRPAFTRFDGDTVFVAATGEIADVEPSVAGALAADTVAAAVRRSVRLATTLAGVPAST